MSKKHLPKQSLNMNSQWLLKWIIGGGDPIYLQYVPLTLMSVHNYHLYFDSLYNLVRSSFIWVDKNYQRSKTHDFFFLYSS